MKPDEAVLEAIEEIKNKVREAKIQEIMNKRDKEDLEVSCAKCIQSGAFIHM